MNRVIVIKVLSFVKDLVKNGSDIFHNIIANKISNEDLLKNNFIKLCSEGI